MKWMTVAMMVVLTLGLTVVAMAADTATQTFDLIIGTISVLDVTDTTPPNLTVVAPVTGGQIPSNPTDNSTYAQYTSTVGGAVAARRITAQWRATDAAPAGTHLELQASPGGGNEGSGTAAITVDATAKDIVTAIASCATGTGGADGAQLAYTLVVDTVTSLVAGASETVEITLTLTDS